MTSSAGKGSDRAVKSRTCGGRHKVPGQRFLTSRSGDHLPRGGKTMSLLKSALGAGFKAVDGAAAWGRMAVSDFVHLRRTLEGDDLDAWDPDYIRRVLPAWRAIMGTYFRGEVRGLDNIPD